MSGQHRGAFILADICGHLRAPALEERLFSQCIDVLPNCGVIGILIP